jgi:hypothetical protein
MKENIMAQTTFSGPVASQNGFIGGTATDPIVVTTSGNISQSYATTSATSGDTRLSYNKLTFTAAGSGETLRAFSVVNCSYSSSRQVKQLTVLTILYGSRYRQVQSQAQLMLYVLL